MISAVSILQLLRPQQWVKNVFCFLPVFFDRKMTDPGFVVLAICVFVSYSFAASGIYCFNDIYDVAADRKHPEKCNRPIASGKISIPVGYILMVLCWIVSFIIIWIAPYNAGSERISVSFVVGSYIVLNIAYSTYLKHKPIVDVFIIAIGFVLRVLAGGLATQVWLSQWIILMTFLLALFLAFAKRRDDVVLYKEYGIKVRGNVDRYNVEFLNQAICIVASITMVCYIMYTVSTEIIERFGSQHIYMTSIFVLAGIIRYLHVTIVDIKSGSPTKVLLKDRFIQMTVILWGGHSQYFFIFKI